MKRAFIMVPGLLVAASVWAAATIEGHWEGRIETPGPGLDVSVELGSDASGALSGTISIPQQNARDLPLTRVRTTHGGGIEFAIQGVPGDPRFEGTVSADGGAIEGTFRQGGAAYPFSLRRGADPVARARAALDGLDGVIEKALVDFDVPGLGIAVVHGDELVMSRGFGLRNVEGELPMTADTLFAIGSTTKAMTATVLGMLVDDGKLEWDEPVRSYLPAFRLQDPLISVRITPRDLVTHRSGLPRHDLVWYNNNDATRAEIVARLAYLDLSADLREEFQYNNLMFMTAGYLAGELAGTTWEELVRQRLFEPLGMTRSNFSVVESQADADHALPYRAEDGTIERIPFRRIDLIGPAGAVNSSVNEMSRWLTFNLTGGMAGTTRLIRAATLADIQSAHMTINVAPQRPEISQPAYGLGWMIDSYRGHRRVHHGGGIDGFTTSVMLFPDDGFGLVAFANSNSGLPILVNQTAADRVLELDPIEWIGESHRRRELGLALAEKAEERLTVTRISGTRPSHELAAYAGRYQHPGYGTLEILRDGDRLLLRFNDITAPLEHWHYDVWNGADTDGDPTFENQKLNFRTDTAGYVSTVEVNFEPRTDPIAFEKQPDAQLSDPEYLARFAGTYVFGTGQRTTVSLAGNTLRAVLPGRPVLTLAPHLSGRFALEGLRGYSFEFVQEDGAVTLLRSHQPNGVFEAKRVESATTER